MKDEIARNEVKLLAYQVTDEAKQLERVVLKVLGKWSMANHEIELGAMKRLLNTIREASSVGREHLQAFDHLMDVRQKDLVEMDRRDAAHSG